MNEFDLIDAIVAALGDTTAGDDVIVGPGDDAAVLALPPGHELLVTADTLVAGRHFPSSARADLVGYRAIAVNLSDIAAMAGDARFLTVATTLPELDVEWTQRFAFGIATAARRYGAKIVGGNISRGELAIAVTAFGSVPEGQALVRSGARVGDEIWVSGALGGSKLGLADAGNEVNGTLDALLEAFSQTVQPVHRYFLPQPRLALGRALRTIATAAIDVSDGFAQDLGHLAKASGVGVDVDLATIPVFQDVPAIDAIGHSDDYELIFTAPKDRHADVRKAAAASDTTVTCVGKASQSAGIRFMHNGERVAPPEGYLHF